MLYVKLFSSKHSTQTNKHNAMLFIDTIPYVHEYIMLYTEDQLAPSQCHRMVCMLFSVWCSRKKHINNERDIRTQLFLLFHCFNSRTVIVIYSILLYSTLLVAI